MRVRVVRPLRSDRSPRHSGTEHIDSSIAGNTDARHHHAHGGCVVSGRAPSRPGRGPVVSAPGLLRSAFRGAVAQQVERCHGMAEARGSIPRSSTRRDQGREVGHRRGRPVILLGRATAPGPPFARGCSSVGMSAAFAPRRPPVRPRSAPLAAPGRNWRRRVAGSLPDGGWAGRAHTGNEEDGNPPRSGRGDTRFGSGVPDQVTGTARRGGNARGGRRPRGARTVRVPPCPRGRRTSRRAGPALTCWGEVGCAGHQKTGCSSMAERRAGGAEVAGPIPASPTWRAVARHPQRA